MFRLLTIAVLAVALTSGQRPAFTMASGWAMNDQAYLWLARIQLRSQDWSGLLDTINNMPAHLYQENEWQYWWARAFEYVVAALTLRSRLRLATRSRSPCQRWLVYRLLALA